MKRSILVLLVACGGKPTPSTTQNTTTTADDCKAAAAKMVRSTAIKDKDGLAAALEVRCQSDAWSAESAKCLAEKGEAGPCVLTDAQRAGIEQARSEISTKEITSEDVPAPPPQ